MPNIGTIWLTGLPCSGKTTLANQICDDLLLHNRRAYVLDGDEIRKGLCADLGFSRDDRREQSRRVAHMAKMITNVGAIAIVALISPYAEDRMMARKIHGSIPFLEVWLDTPLAICRERDIKGLYAAANLGALKDLTGVDSPYERPSAPDARILGGYVRDNSQLVIELLDSLPAHS